MKKIVILTHAPQRTLGDPSAAAKLQRLLLDNLSNQFKDLEVMVVVNVRQEDEEPVRNLFSQQMSYKLINGIDVGRGYFQLEDAISDADLIISYPTPHFITKEVAKLLTNHAKHVISLGEYDYDLAYQLANRGKAIEFIPGATFLSSGLEKDNLGIFIEKQSGQIHPTDSAKLPNELLSGNSELYFGYFNKLFESSTIANPSRFIAFAANASTKKEVDIILPLQPKDSKDVSSESRANILFDSLFIEDLEDFSQVQLAYFPPSPTPPIYIIYERVGNKLLSREVSAEEFEVQKSKSEKIIRIVNPFPLHKDSIIALMEKSAPVSLLTGDQSFSEALSLLKIIFYQAMPWKKKFYEALTATSQNYGTLQTWFKMFLDKSTPIRSLVDFYKKNQQTLIDETEALRNDLIHNKNFSDLFLDYISHFLNNNPYQRFTAFIDHLRKHPELYADKKKADGTYALSKETLTKHIHFYLKKATDSEEKNKMMNYFESHIDSIFPLSNFEKVWYFMDFKASHPDLNFSISAIFFIDSLRELPASEEEVYDNYGAPIKDPEYKSEKVEGLEDFEFRNCLRETMMSLGFLLKLLPSANISQYSSDEKLEILKLLRLHKALVYKNGAGNEHWIKFLQNESNPQILGEAIKLFFITPCYRDMPEGVAFDTNEPNLFFYMANYHGPLLKALLENPMAIRILFEELFLVDQPEVRACNTKMNEIVLNALLFPSRQTSSYSFFQSSAKEMLVSKEKEFIAKLLSVEERDQEVVLHFFKSKLDTEPQKIDLFRKNFGDVLPPYLQNFLNDHLSVKPEQ